MQRSLFTILIAPAMLAAALGGVALLRAQNSAGERSELPPAPTLHRLSSETQALYEHVRAGIVRIQLPPTHWPATASDNMIDKWKGRVSPEVLERLEQEQLRSAAGGNVQMNAQIQSTTRPSRETNREDQNVLVAPIPPRLSVYPRPDGGIELGPFSGEQVPYDAQVPGLSLKVIGVLVDEAGHVLVPLYIEPSAIGAEPLRVTTGDGRRSMATFVGSDRQTNITVFKLTSPAGKPVRIGGGRPADGSLVMVLSPGGDAGRLGIWTGGQQDRGIVVAMDGGVAGFARYGQFLSGAFAQPLVDQIIEFGRVRRATLGVIIEETETPYGQRAMRIERVLRGSPAEKIGLRPDDYILALAGTPVGDLPSFAAAIAARDGETELEILRGDSSLTLTVVLEPK